MPGDGFDAGFAPEAFRQRPIGVVNQHVGHRCEAERFVSFLLIDVRHTNVGQAIELVRLANVFKAGNGAD